MQPERRYISIMFCDMVNSTSLSDQMEAEDYIYILNAFHQSVTQAINIQYGYVAQFLGDGILAYFGYPTFFQNSEYKSVKAAIDIIHNIDKLNENLQNFYHLELSARIGIHSGEVIIAECGLGHRKERLALGGASNIASRIMTLAQPNEIVISDVTFHAIKNFIECRSLGFQDLKGLRDQFEVFVPQFQKSMV